MTRAPLPARRSLVTCALGAAFVLGLTHCGSSDSNGDTGPGGAAGSGASGGAAGAGAGGTTAFADWQSIELGAGFARGGIDGEIAYRPELLSYRADVDGTGAQLLHTIVATTHVAVTRSLDVVVSAAGTTGADRDVLAVLANLAWRRR